MTGQAAGPPGRSPSTCSAWSSTRCSASSPYRIDRDGRPYVPVGDGGIVLGLRLGDSVFALAGDHAAPGACLVHPDPAARHALAVYACIGNQRVGADRPGARARAAWSSGKRGEEGRVIVGLRPGGPGPDAAVRSGTRARVRPGLAAARPPGRGHRAEHRPRRLRRAAGRRCRRTARGGDRGRADDRAEQAGRQRHRPARRGLGPGPAAARARRGGTAPETCCSATWSRSPTSTRGATWGTGAAG